MKLQIYILITIANLEMASLARSYRSIKIKEYNPEDFQSHHIAHLMVTLGRKDLPTSYQFRIRCQLPVCDISL